MYTALNPSANACFSAATPAPIIAGVTAGIVEKAAASLLASAPTKASREVGGRPCVSSFGDVAKNLLLETSCECGAVEYFA